MKNHLLKSMKIAAAAVLAIFIAGELGLKYSATAGIITVLSIRNTKRETLKSAANRALAYVCALILAACCFRVLGYTLSGFAVYLLFFAFLCMAAGWQEAITMDSVLITHFMSEGTMNTGQLMNETQLFCIGTGLGILVNLHLHRKEADFARLADEVDGQIRGILGRMAHWLPAEDREAYKGDCFIRMEEAIRRARLCAAANYNNSLLKKDTGELDYIRMREKQSVVLKGIYENIKRLEYLPEQAGRVAELIGQIEQAYHRENTVEELLSQLQGFLEEMKQEALPGSREEFEARAILFYILMQLQELLQIKREFVEAEK